MSPERFITEFISAVNERKPRGSKYQVSNIHNEQYFTPSANAEDIGGVNISRMKDGLQMIYFINSGFFKLVRFQNIVGVSYMGDHERNVRRTLSKVVLSVGKSSDTHKQVFPLTELCCKSIAGMAVSFLDGYEWSK